MLNPVTFSEILLFYEGRNLSSTETRKCEGGDVLEFRRTLSAEALGGDLPGHRRTLSAEALDKCIF